MRSLDIGATGMLAQQMNVDIISNNIANMTTSGFKRQRIDFKDMVYQNIDRPGAQSSDIGTTLPSGLQIGLGVQVGAAYRIHEQGAVQITENPLDMAVTGDGFFQIQMPNGDTAYTRSGVFQINENGEIVTTKGFLMEPNLVVPEDAISVEINQNGEVFVEQSGQANLSNIGQIELATFVNPAGLEAIGDNLFMETEGSGTPTTGTPGDTNFGTVRQGSVEQSNVNVVEEITSLITAQRAYEMNSTVIRTSDEMLQSVAQLR
ncbi:MAG: flagellar basal-body rod protein FlgG [Alphaproteobacteria bacterium]|jgi:flagellar basal-body rod protein FlgG|nr:flagellar basal-body rod protein FlgG [Alphaproteobacteria bacterium]MDP7223042.1 flagellar basal-body rod protein FlgG [Alphaproteobacteria bacterium]